ISGGAPYILRSNHRFTPYRVEAWTSSRPLQKVVENPAAGRFWCRQSASAKSAARPRQPARTGRQRRSGESSDMTESTRGVLLGVLAMTLVVVASNILVQHPVPFDWVMLGVPANELWTWGALSYPVAFLVTDLCNRTMGPARARRVVYAGFAVAVLLSIWL